MHPGSEPPGGPVLVRAVAAARAERQWDDAAQRVLDGEPGFLRVVGGPGSGKTTLLAEAAARRLRAGGEPDQVLVLTATRRAADALRSEVTGLLTSDDAPPDVPRTVREPLVRTVHSYAFGILRAQAAAEGSPPPRLLSGPEQDAVVRDLLAGDLEAGAEYWPERLRPALTVPGFAEELRDLLMRAAERGLGPEDLVRFGRKRRRDEWVAAGQFWKQYEQVTLLHAAGGSALAVAPAASYDAAELVTAALLSLLGDERLLARERERVRYVFVDDAQHLDPLQWRLLRLIGEGAAQFVVAGDEDQSVYSFRGAEPAEFADCDPSGERTVELRAGWRMTATVRDGVQRVATAAPRPLRVPEPAEGQGVVEVRRFRTPAAEAAWVADQLRRAHLLEGVPWSEMAIVVRSPGRTFPVLQRALRGAGVPIAASADELPLARNPAVRPLLSALRMVAEPSRLDAELADELLASRLGGADPLALRRLRRGLRRLELAAGGERPSDELLVEALRADVPEAGLAEAEARPLRRLSAVLAAGRKAHADSKGVEEVLWSMWSASGLQGRWLKTSERGGSLGRQADAELDAVVALFHAAAQYADRLPHEGVAGFADYLLAQRIAGDSLAPSAAKSAGVELTTAHGAAGREWTVVAIAGVQEGSWPDLRPRGSLLGVELLVDLLSGVDAPGVSAIAPVLAEERRLFHVAASRARSRLLVSACEGEDEQPSRFLDDLAGTAAEEEPAAPAFAPPRPLVLSRLVGELRAAVCDERSDPTRRQRAATQLARLAAAGVAGAHPSGWYGLAGASTEEPLATAEDVITVSPSNVALLDRCPLRWVLEKHGGADPAQLAAVTGVLVHGLAQRAAEGASAEELRAELDDAWRRVDAGAPWFAGSERARVGRMLDAFLFWLRVSRAQLTEIAVETEIDVELPAEEGEQRVRLVGRVDRMEADGEGRRVVVDIKTGKTPVTGKEAAEHPQLATYQLAISLTGDEPGGGRLLYLTRADGKELTQPPLDADGRAEWLGRVRSAAAASAGPVYLAREGSDCTRCPAKKCCPLQPEGRQVTS